MGGGVQGVVADEAGQISRPFFKAIGVVFQDPDQAPEPNAGFFPVEQIAQVGQGMLVPGQGAVVEKGVGALEAVVEHADGLDGRFLETIFFGQCVEDVVAHEDVAHQIRHGKLLSEGVRKDWCPVCSYYIINHERRADPAANKRLTI